jgi:hypothetical protein
MKSETRNEGPTPAQQARPKMTRAGRLLQILTTSDEDICTRIARRLKVPVHDLMACRDGSRPLEPEVQILLAALVLEIAPQCAPLAHRLYAQAQSALRVKEGVVEAHLTYHRARWG